MLGIDPHSLINRIPAWLPVMVAMFSVVAFGVRADAQIHDLKEKVKVASDWNEAGTDRLARIETQLGNQERQLDYIIKRLDDK